MNTTRTRWLAHLRIVWAITAKDILEALKNKNIISVIVVSLLMVVFYRVYPGLSAALEPPAVLIYDEGASALPARLEGSRAVQAWTGYRSLAHLQALLAEGDVPELGLVIPAGFDAAAAGGGELTLPGYVMYWVSDEDAAALRAKVEAEIERLIGRPVAIQLQAPIVHEADSGGIGIPMGSSVIFVLVMVGLTLVPHLMLEEKKNRTLDVMLVSPAGAGHLAAAKALAGLFYTVLGGGIALAINHDLILHWPLAIAALMAGALFLVALGLWLGLRIEDRGQLTLWAWVLILPLLLPVFIVLMTPLIPAVVVQILNRVPTVVVFNLLRAALADPIALSEALLQLAWVLAWAAAALALVAWQVQRQDRAAEGRASPPSLAGATPPPTPPLAGEGCASPPSLAGKGAGGLGVSLRIILAIAAKDIREAVRNRLFLSILLGIGLVIATNAALPLLLFRDTIPTAVVYDEAQASGLQHSALRELARRDDLRLIFVDSRGELERAVTEVRGTRLGLVTPAALDATGAGGSVVLVEGYAAHWANPDRVSQWTAFFSEQISAASGAPVRVSLAAPLYPTADAGGEPLMAAILLAIIIATLELALVPLLLVEEKEAHTLDTLLVSPAGLGQLITAKTLTGFLYCLAAAGLLGLFKWPLFASLPVALLAVLLGAACVIGLGLLLGVLADNPSTVSVWGVAVLLGLIGLAAAAFLAPATWPAALRSFLSWLPGAQMINLLRYSMAGDVPAALLWSGVAALAAAAVAIYGLVGLALRRVQG